jgi:hypothetical protein
MLKEKETIDLEKQIHSVIQRKKDIHFIPFTSPFWNEENLISYLTDEHVEGTIVKMVTLTRREIDIELDLFSGAIFVLPSGYTAIYVGMGQPSDPSRSPCPYIFVRVKKGLMSWMDATLEDIQNKENLYPIPLLQNVVPKPPKPLRIDHKPFRPQSKELFHHLEHFTDTQLICKDGEIKVNRFLLSTHSNYFLAYFTRYVQDLPRINYPKIFIEEYTKFLILKETNVKMEDQIEEWIEFASFIQDFKFVKYIYHKVWNLCDRESQLNLNQHISKFIINK